jgi:hypothetical protein
LALKARGREDQELARSLRTQRLTWVEVADVLRARRRCTPRAALRLAHGWSQGEAARQWNQRWPDDAKTFKNFSYWEQWPSPTGHAPSFEVLGKLAELYQCAVTDLLTDCPSYRLIDEFQPSSEIKPSLISGLLAQNLKPGDSPRVPPKLTQILATAQGMDSYELSRIIAEWATVLLAEERRRSLILKLNEALALAAESEALTNSSPPDGLIPWKSAQPYHQLNGIWKSHYTYRSSRQKGTFEAEHYLVARQLGLNFTAESVPHSTGSQVKLDLVVDGAIASGRWWERTPVTSRYQGASYHGVIQLVIDPRGQRLRGRWLGFNSKYEISDGIWDLLCVDSSTSAESQRAYHLKA